MKKLVVITLLLFSVTSVAQKKILSLKESVSQRSLMPDRISNFQWIPGTLTYTYTSKDGQQLYQSSPENATIDLLKIDEINQVLGTKLNGFFGMEWLNENELIMNDGNVFVRFNTKSKTGALIHSVSEQEANTLFHPESGNIAYTEENNVKLITPNSKGKVISVTSETNKNIVSGQSIARSEFGISGGLFWSLNGNFLAFYQKDESGVHDYPLLDINQTPGALQSIKYPMAGQTSENPRLGIYNVAKGKTIYINPKGAKDDYITNVSFTPDEKYVLIAEVNRDQNHMWLNAYDVVSGKFVRTLVEESNDKWVEPEHPAFFPSNHSNNFIWISERNGYNNLYYYDFSGKLINQLTSHSFVVKDILQADKDGKTVYYSATGEDPTNTLVYAVDLESGTTKLLTSTGSHFVSFSSNGTYFYDAFSSGTIAHKAQICDNNGKAVKVLLESTDKLTDYAIGTAELGRLTAKDSSQLVYRLIKPSNFDPTKKYPVLVYVYGGPHAQMITNSWLYGANLWMYWMAEQGYLVFTLDNRGSGERGFAFESQIHRRLGTVEMEDQLNGVNFLKSLPYVDASRLAVHGWSFGGFMTSSLMLRNPGVFNVGVAGGPVTDWKYYEIMYGERYMDRPEQNPEGYQQASLLTHAGNLKGELLLIHGTSDDVVVMQHGLALVKKFVDLGIQMDFFPYPMHKHNVIGKDRVHLMDKVLNYIIEKNHP